MLLWRTIIQLQQIHVRVVYDHLEKVLTAAAIPMQSWRGMHYVLRTIAVSMLKFPFLIYFKISRIGNSILRVN